MRQRQTLIRVTGWLALCTGLACSKARTEDPARKSPDVTMAPAPLVSGQKLVGPPDVGALATNSASTAASPDVKAPTPLSLNQPPKPDLDSLAVGLGLRLVAHLEWPGKEKPLRTQTQVETEDDAEQARFLLDVELHGAGKMKIELLSQAFSLRRGTQLLSRYDALGMFVVWPDSTRYRVLAQGALRTLFAEGRADVAPASPGEFDTESPGTRLDLQTQRFKLTTPHGELLLEQAAVEGSDLGGPLLCRFLLEWLNAQDGGAICQRGQVPLWAEFKSPENGQLRFIVTGLQPTPDTQFSTPVPPPLAKLVHRELPTQSAAIFNLAVPAKLSGGPPASLRVVNRTEQGVYWVTQGLRVVFVPPRSNRQVTGLAAGDYPYVFRGFFGDEAGGEGTVSVPGTVTLQGSTLDAGTPP